MNGFGVLDPMIRSFGVTGYVMREGKEEKRERVGREGEEWKRQKRGTSLLIEPLTSQLTRRDYFSKGEGERLDGLP